MTGAGRNIGEEIAKLFAAEGAQRCHRRSRQAARRARCRGHQGSGRRRDAVRGRRIQRQRRDGAGEGRRRPLRPHRHPGQQCRDLRQQTHLRYHRRGMGPRAGGDAEEPVPDGQACRPADGHARRRPHRQYRLDLGLHGPQAAPSPIRPPRAASPTSRAPWRCSSRRTTSGSMPSCPTRSARRSARTSSIRRARCPTWSSGPGQPVEAAKAVLFLVTDNSSFVWGANLFVDGGVLAMDLS